MYLKDSNNEPASGYTICIFFRHICWLMKLPDVFMMKSAKKDLKIILIMT